MSASYYVRSQGKVLGPFSFEDLKAKAAKGHLKKTHQVSMDRKTWQAARSVEGLFAPPPKLPQQVKAEPAAPVRAEPELVEVRLLEEEPMEVALAEGETEWHYCLPGDEETQGPIPESKLRKLLQGGRLPSDTLVWNDALTDWVEATRIPALSSGPARDGAEPVIFSEVPILDSGPGYPAHGGSQLSVPPLAATSLILGILAILLGLTGLVLSLMKASVGFIVGIFIPTAIATILAIIFGHISLAQIKANRKLYQGKGIASAGLIIGYIVLGSLILGGSAWMIVEMAT